MTYDYVRRTYGVDPTVGDQVRHSVTRYDGVVTPENPSQAHYVMVRFGDRRFSSPCHPGELECRHGVSLRLACAACAEEREWLRRAPERRLLGCGS